MQIHISLFTGDESYHAACFTCRSCSRKIEELVFAKTSQGIYCMACHNERVARSRRHAEAKKKKQAKQKREEEQKKEVSMVDSVVCIFDPLR
jgi:ribosomal protein L12E/L44/L45/RPP1/RPP2